MNLPDDFVFSQSSLQDYVDCPRRFELRYLIQQRWPAPEVDDLLEHERRMALGERFHHLVQQHQAGIPSEVFQKHIDDTELREWFTDYLASGLGSQGVRRAEVSLTVPLGEYALTAKFDLVVLEGNRALIVDWKTGQTIPKLDTLRQRLQTVVYRYVLATGGATLNKGQSITPEQIEMVYWYAAHRGKTLTIPYDGAEVAADEARLLALVNEINIRPDFPLTPDVQKCRFCVYRSLCNRGTRAGAFADYDSDTDHEGLTDFTIDLDQIAEIEF